MILSFKVMGEPVPKGRPRFNRKTGTVFTPKSTVDYESTIAWAARVTRIKFGDREVAVFADFYCKSKRKADGDNFQKCVWDALQNAGVIDNDSQIMQWGGNLYRGVKEPRTEIRVYPVDQIVI